MSADPQSWSLAEQEVESACRLLLDPSPQNLDRSSSLLSSAISLITHEKPLAAEAYALRAALERARQLLESAADYHCQWHRILRSMTAGYNAAGAPAALAAANQVSLRG